jgi:hypothetical protein
MGKKAAKRKVFTFLAQQAPLLRDQNAHRIIGVLFMGR